MRNVVFVDALRTPFGKMGGGLRKFYPSELCGMTVKALVDRSGILTRGGKVDCVFMGSAAGDAHCTNLPAMPPSTPACPMRPWPALSRCSAAPPLTQ